MRIARRDGWLEQRIELGTRIAQDDAQSILRGTLRQRLARPRRDDCPMAAPRELAGEPPHLPLATAPSALRVDVQNVDRHAAQLT